MGGWDTGLFDCFADCKVLIFSWCCAPVQIAYQKAAVEDFLLSWFFPFCCAISVRSKIRTKYGIEGGLIGDFFSVLCCGLCAISQQTRQLDMKGAKPAGMCMEK